MRDAGCGPWLTVRPGLLALRSASGPAGAGREKGARAGRAPQYRLDALSIPERGRVERSDIVD